MMETTLFTLVEQLPVGVLVIDPSGNMVGHNAAALSLLGIEIEDLLLSDVRDCFDCRQLYALVERLREGEPGIAQSVLEFAGRFVTCTAKSAEGLAGDGRYVVVTLQDATQLRRLEQIKQDFVATILHRMRSPVATLKTTLSILRSQAPQGVDPDILDVMEMSGHEVDRLNALLNQLRDLFTIETGLAAMEIETEVFAVGKAIERAVSALARACPDAAARVVVSGDTVAAVEADFHKLSRAIETVAANALIFSANTVAVKVTCDGSMVSVSVADTGIGMGAPAQRLLFTKFFREDNEITRRTDGNGLGLFIAKAWIELMGGAISCESIMGRGSTFTLTIPRTKRT